MCWSVSALVLMGEHIQASDAHLTAGGRTIECEQVSEGGPKDFQIGACYQLLLHTLGVPAARQQRVEKTVQAVKSVWNYCLAPHLRRFSGLEIGRASSRGNR